MAVCRILLHGNAFNPHKSELSSLHATRVPRLPVRPFRGDAICECFGCFHHTSARAQSIVGTRHCCPHTSFTQKRLPPTAWEARTLVRLAAPRPPPGPLPVGCSPSATCRATRSGCAASPAKAPRARPAGSHFQPRSDRWAWTWCAATAAAAAAAGPQTGCVAAPAQPFVPVRLLCYMYSIVSNRVDVMRM